MRAAFLLLLPNWKSSDKENATSHLHLRDRIETSAAVFKAPLLLEKLVRMRVWVAFKVS